MTARHWPDIPKMTLWPWPESPALTIAVAGEGRRPPGADDPTRAAAIASRWAALRQDNPRLHDGQILAVSSLHAEDARVVVHVDSFKRLAVQDDALDLGVRLLGVKTLITARDGAGAEHVLIARRGSDTRIYGGLWETAPAGGLDVPPPGTEVLGAEAVIAAVRQEARDELGVRLEGDGAQVVAIVRDDVARCYDFFCTLPWPGVIDPRKGLVCTTDACANDWEYLDAAWLARDQARAFDQRDPGAIVGPSRAVLRWMGWI